MSYVAVGDVADNDSFHARLVGAKNERKHIASIMRLLESWGQLNIRDYPLVTALVEKLERGEKV